MIFEHHFEDAEQSAASLANRIADILSQSVEERGEASIALSGGSSPRQMLEILSKKPINWSNVTIALVDERWVDPASSDSNEHLVRETLLKGPAKKALFYPLKNEALSPCDGQQEAEKVYKAINWPLDIIVLGMGEDGHTASLFPNAAELSEALTTHSHTVAVTPPVAPFPRLSLSAKAILSSRHIFLQISGNHKNDVYRAALQKGPVEKLPIRVALQQNQTPVDVWICR